MPSCLSVENRGTPSAFLSAGVDDRQAPYGESDAQGHVAVVVANVQDASTDLLSSDFVTITARDFMHDDHRPARFFLVQGPDGCKTERLQTHAHQG